MARSLVALTAFLALASCIATSQAANITAPTIVSAINSLTTLSQNLQSPALQINLLSPALFVIGQGPFFQVFQGLQDIAKAGVTTANMLATNTVGPFSLSDQTAIFNAFRTFVTIHQQLLNILIGKAGLFSQVPYIGQPISAALKSIENVVDTIANVLINACQDVAADLTLQRNSLMDTIQKAEKAYDGLNVSVNGNTIQPGARKMLSMA